MTHSTLPDSYTQQIRRYVLRFLLCCSFLLLHIAAKSQSQRELTIEQSLRIALENSYSARNAVTQLHVSEATAEAARRALYSNVDLEFDLPQFNRTLAPQFNALTGRTEFFPLENMLWSGRININQPVIWTNSTLTLSGILYRQDQATGGSGGTFFRDYYANLAVILRQPLFVPNTLRISLRRAEIDFEESLADYKRNVLDLIYAVTENFYQAFSSQEQQVIQQQRVEQQQESFKTARRKFNAGLIAEVEALQFEVDLAAAKNDQLSAENQFVSRSNSFKLLIGLPLQEDIKLVLTDTTIIPVNIEPEVAIQKAKQIRPDLQRAQNNIERSELTLDEVSSRRSIRGDITLSYGLSNNDELLRSLTVDPRETRGATLTFSVPVFDWGRHAQEMEAAEARLESAKLTAGNVSLTIEKDITDLLRSIVTTSERVLIMLKSRTIAEKANSINTSRFDMGTISYTELSQSQTRLLQARLGALAALIDYTIAYEDLSRRTGFDFRNGTDVLIPE